MGGGYKSNQGNARKEKKCSKTIVSSKYSEINYLYKKLDKGMGVELEKSIAKSDCKRFQWS